MCFLKIKKKCPQKAVLKRIQVRPFFCLPFSSSLLPRKNSLRICYKNISLLRVPAFSYESTSFASPAAKIRWTMSMDDVGLEICLLGTLNIMVTQENKIPWCKPSWSRDEFNIQSHILQGLGTTSWSMV